MTNNVYVAYAYTAVQESGFEFIGVFDTKAGAEAAMEDAGLEKVHGLWYPIDSESPIYRGQITNLNLNEEYV